jgi:hypothetical protein
MAGGAPLALSIVAGPIIAGALGFPPSIGVLVGAGFGIAVAVLIWFLSAR